MGKKRGKQVVKKKLIGFDKPMLDALERRLKDAKDETEALRRALIGEDKFSPSIERWISAKEAETGFSRQEVIQFLVLEALRLKDSRFRLLEEPQGKQ